MPRSKKLEEVLIKAAEAYLVGNGIKLRASETTEQLLSLSNNLGIELSEAVVLYEHAVWLNIEEVQKQLDQLKLLEND